MAQQSPDDALENERPDKLRHAVGREALPEDNDPPAAPADDISPDRLGDDHPSQDTDVDEDEKYQEGSARDEDY